DDRLRPIHADGRSCGCSGQRYPRDDRGSRSWRAAYLKIASDLANALAHARMTQARTLPRSVDIEADTVVAHSQLESSPPRRQRNADCLCLGMTDNIAQRLLRDAEQAQRDVLRNSFRYLTDLESDATRLAM